MRSLKWLAAAIAVLACGAAAADEPGSRWASRPSPADLAAAEGKVVKPGVFYRAAVRCAVVDDGALNGCKVVRETPAGSGFGAALLSLAPRYRRKPPDRDDPREVVIADSVSGQDAGPDWLKRPSPDDLLAVFPAEAYRRGIGGRAVIDCVVTAQGALTDCLALEESPPDAGFGAAAIALSAQFVMKPARLHGRPVLSTVTIPITFVTYGPGGGSGAKKVVPASLPWSEAPSYADVAAAYPPKARAERKGGHVILACAMNEAGRLRNCDVVASTPRGYGFDIAAKRLAKMFALPIRSEADRDATRRIGVHLPFTFDPAMLDGATPVVGKPEWAALPTHDEVVAAFSKVEVVGTARARLACTVQPGGAVAGCKVTSETPRGLGVGAAAVALAPTFRLTTWSDEGLPVVGGVVNIPLRYEGKTPPKPAQGDSP